MDFSLLAKARRVCTHWGLISGKKEEEESLLRNSLPNENKLKSWTRVLSHFFITALSITKYLRTALRKGTQPLGKSVFLLLKSTPNINYPPAVSPEFSGQRQALQSWLKTTFTIVVLIRGYPSAGSHRLENWTYLPRWNQPALSRNV